MSPFSVWSDWSSPTQARICSTGMAASQRSPSTTVTKSGATTTRPRSAGIEIDATSRVARSQIEATLAASCWRRANAGNSTSWMGPAMRLNGTSITLYAIA